MLTCSIIFLTQEVTINHILLTEQSRRCVFYYNNNLKKKADEDH